MSFTNFHHPGFTAESTDAAANHQGAFNFESESASQFPNNHSTMEAFRSQADPAPHLNTNTTPQATQSNEGPAPMTQSNIVTSSGTLLPSAPLPAMPGSNDLNTYAVGIYLSQTLGPSSDQPQPPTGMHFTGYMGYSNPNPYRAATAYMGTTVGSTSPPLPSPTGSTDSHSQPLPMTYTPTTVSGSPALVSPMAALQVADASPAPQPSPSPWTYAPLNRYTPVGTGNLAMVNPGMGSVAHNLQMGGSVVMPVTPPRLVRTTSSRKSPRSAARGGLSTSLPRQARLPYLTGGNGDEDLLEMPESPSDEENRLGLAAGVTEGDVTRPIPGRREEVRRARIESEQRRRNELRGGFDRLKDALPPTTQRSSKSNILDRSIQHIQSLEAINGVLTLQIDAANREIAELRRSNQTLVEAVARASGAGGPGPTHLMIPGNQPHITDPSA